MTLTQQAIISTMNIKNLIVYNENGMYYQISLLTKKAKDIDETSEILIEPTDKFFMQGLFYLDVQSVDKLATNDIRVRAGTRNGEIFSVRLNKKQADKLADDGRLIIRQVVPYYKALVYKNLKAIPISSDIILQDKDNKYNTRSIILKYGKDAYNSGFYDDKQFIKDKKQALELNRKQTKELKKSIKSR